MWQEVSTPLAIPVAPRSKPLSLYVIIWCLQVLGVIPGLAWEIIGCGDWLRWHALLPRRFQSIIVPGCRSWGTARCVKWWARFASSSCWWLVIPHHCWSSQSAVQSICQATACSQYSPSNRTVLIDRSIGFIHQTRQRELTGLLVTRASQDIVPPGSIHFV
jgi:hypothetical protein